MEEYPRILIEEYCWSHNIAKSRRLAKLLEMSYDVFAEISGDDTIFLEKAIVSEKNQEFRETLKDPDQFLCGYYKNIEKKRKAKSNEVICVWN